MIKFAVAHVRQARHPSGDEYILQVHFVFLFKYCESKTKEVPKLRSIRVSRTSGRGREIQYKSICPADFDMSPSKFLGAAYFSWDPSLVSLSNRTAGRGGQQNARV